MKDAISTVQLAKLTGDNRKWIYRQAKAGRIPSMVKGGTTPGTGAGIQYRTGEDLNRWIARRCEKKGDIASTNLLLKNIQAELASARGVSGVVKAICSLDQVANTTDNRKLLAVVSKVSKPGVKESLACAMEGLAKSLNRAASEIRKLP